jgi:hypothetical protein
VSHAKSAAASFTGRGKCFNQQFISWFTRSRSVGEGSAKPTQAGIIKSLHALFKAIDTINRAVRRRINGRAESLREYWLPVPEHQASSRLTSNFKT